MKSNSEIITELTEYLAMPQSQLAKECGLTSSSLSYIVKEKYRITENTANKIVAKFPDVNIDFLLTGEGNVSNHPIKRQPNTKGKRQFNTVETLARKIEQQDNRIDALLEQIKQLKEDITRIIDANKA